MESHVCRNHTHPTEFQIFSESFVIFSQEVPVQYEVVQHSTYCAYVYVIVHTVHTYVRDIGTLVLYILHSGLGDSD